MAEHQKLSYLLQNLQCYDNRYNHNTLIKCIPTLIHHAQRSDLHGLLELLNSTHNTDLQVKILSILSAYLMSSFKNIDAIITFNPMYEKIQSVLSGGLPRKTTVVLNFLSTLLYVDHEDDNTRRKSLAMHAQNMIRVSGCLAIMSDIFTNCMVYQDTWMSLCRCLSETCRGSELNQSYCTHLIPMSIQRCIQGNEYVFLVLQSLIQNHERNIQLFLESNGVALFSRELLQYDACMQLLNILVQNSSTATMLLCKTNLIQHLSDFLRLYGPNSQSGQWASLILYHLDSKIKGITKGPNEKSKCDAPENMNVAPKILPSSINNNDRQTSNLDSTVNLLNNVMKEVFLWKSTSKFGKDQTSTTSKAFIQPHKNRNKTTLFVDNMQFKTKQSLLKPMRLFNFSSAKVKRPQKNKSYELSFSFLQKDSGRKMASSDLFNQQSYLKSQISDTTSTKYNESNRTKDPDISNIGNIKRKTSLLQQTFIEMDREHNESAVSVIKFKPKFMSTPKKHEKAKPLTRILHTSRASFKAKKINKLKTSQEITIIDKDIKHRSFSNRLLGAINESCTTFVKTVKNIFKTKGNDTVEVTATARGTNTEDVQSCTYSFTDYMRKRDAIFDDKCREYSKKECQELSTVAASCRTCNDTINLKHKFANDEYLRHTIKKLKLGINVYGCDFKKISKTFWPHDAYMTPAILYNLYRKLLMK